MKRKRIFAEVCIVFVLFYLAVPLNADTPWLHTDGNRIKDPAGNVVVLRGVDLVDLGATEMWYGGAINMIDRLTNKSDTQGSSPGWYPKAIRIAIFPTDSGFSSPFPFTPGNNDFYNNLLRPVVDYCRTKDMYVIIDWHYIDNTYSHVSTTSEFWTYMAPRFANDSHVLFELYNEPINTSFGSDAANWQSVRTDMQTWINIVRTYAPNNLILVAGPSWSQVIGPAATYPLTGNNIVIVSHIYPGHWLSGSQSWYTGHINTCLTVYPVFMTEWGFTTTSDSLLNGTITNYGAPLSTFREARKISNSAWVASYDWQPPMFNTSWNLLVGEGQMGGFTKDTLYTYRNSDQPGGGGNLPPSVSITSPANGATFTAPANITIDATASDADGTVTQVMFYQGMTLLGTDTSSPYSFTWSNVGAGSYSLTADAIDNGGATTTSSPVNITVNGGGSGNIEVRARGSIGDETIDIRVNGNTVATHTLSTSFASYFGNGSGTVQVHFTNDNGSRDVQIDYVVIDSTTYQSEDMPINTGVWTTTCGGSYNEWLHCNGYIEYSIAANNPPTVSITSPANGATFTAPANITINATASDSDGSVTQVQFYQGTTLLGTDTSSPYSYTWNSVAAGSYSLTAIATDNGGATTTSTAVSITVNPAPNNPPTVSITSPANGATFTAPANITINATASDTDGTITQVQFYQGTTLLGTDSSSPYSYTWNSVAAGSYSLTARATDDDGASTTSTAVNITVNNPINNPPTVSITSPANGAAFTAPANITINATASDTDGTITQVEFYQGSTLLGTDTTSPYSYTWSSVGAGSYSLTAKATDNGGATTTSTAVSITVNPAPNNPPTVSITSPANGATFTAPANITINATASDTDGTITQVQFYQGTTLLGTDTSSPYSYTWNSVPAGSYSLTARATDDDGAVTTSTPVNITVNAGGVVTLLNDGFESNFNLWTDGGTTDWDRTTSQKYAGSYSAHAGSSDNDLISDNLNTSGKTSITIDFWFRDDDIDNDDNVYLQLYNGSSYSNFYELGNSTEDTWNHYTVTITSSQYSQYFRTNLRIKFEGTSIDSGENLWIDAVKVTAQ